MPKRKPTERDLELLQMPPIAEQLPVVFPNGQRWSEFRGLCRMCGNRITGANLRGAVMQQATTSIAVEATGYCSSCKLLTRFLVRLHDDGRVTGPMDGQWRTWRPERKCWLQRARRLVRTLLRRR